MDISCSNQYHIRAQVNKVQTHFIQSARGNIAKLNNLHRFGSDAECWEFLHSSLAYDDYLFPVAERVEGGVCGPSPTQRKQKAGNQWAESTGFSGRSNRAVYLHQIVSSGKSPR